MELIIISWIVFCIVVGVVGSNRKIGFAVSFILSLFLSPLIGLIITLSSKTKEDLRLQEELSLLQKKQLQSLDALNKKSAADAADTLFKIKGLYESGVIDEEEFEKMKKRIIHEGGDDSSTKEEASRGGLFSGFSNPPEYVEEEVNDSDYEWDKKCIKLKFNDGVIGNLYYVTDSGDWMVNCTSESEYFSNKETAVKYLYHYLTNPEERNNKIALEEEARLLWERKMQLKKKEKRKSTIKMVAILLLFFVTLFVLIMLSK